MRRCPALFLAFWSLGVSGFCSFFGDVCLGRCCSLLVFHVVLSVCFSVSCFWGTAFGDALLNFGKGFFGAGFANWFWFGGDMALCCSNLDILLIPPFSCLFDFMMHVL